MDDNRAKEFAEEWIDSFNSHDLKRVLSHYADDFEMSSPFIKQVMNEPSGTLKGKEAIGNYWRMALAKLPDLKFVLQDVLVGANGVTILYKNQKDILVAEILVFNSDGKVKIASAYYRKMQEL